MNPQLKPDGMITLVNQGSTTIYSGMLPGVISGKYKLEETLIDLRALASKANVAFVKAEIKGINKNKKELLLAGRPGIEYSLLSLDVGSETNINAKLLFIENKDLAIPIKPFFNALKWINSQDIYKNDSAAKPFIIIGAGFAGIEIAFALRKRWPKRHIKLYTKPGKKFNKNIIKSLGTYDIELKVSNEIVKYPALICTGNKQFDWLLNSGLPLDQNGRILTKNTLQVLDSPELFAVGDCGVIKGTYRPPSGVWAVRSAVPLARNLENMFKGIRLNRWNPQKNAIQLIDLNSRKSGSKAFLSWGMLIIGPYNLISKLKERIDRKFISKFVFNKGMFSTYSLNDEMIKCRGCAAKLASFPLNSALQKLNCSELSSPEDANYIGRLNTGKTLIQSIDGFPSLISDPWLNGRLIAFHACSDIWACGGSVVSAQASVTLPSISNVLQKELLFQVLDGINSALDLQGAKLIGGHTMESMKLNEEPFSIGIETSLSVNGTIGEQEDFWSKGGIKKGDEILISGAIGTGVIFSAFMNGKVNPFDMDNVIMEMNKSKHEVVNYIRQLQKENPNSNVINACTDITGFGLLGHLIEMLKSTNRIQLQSKKESIVISLELENIETYKGVKRLLSDGFESTLAPSNRTFLENIYTGNDEDAGIKLILDNIKLGSFDYNILLKVLTDPQTCGPLVISCPSIYAEKLKQHGSWKRIGFVS